MHNLATMLLYGLDISDVSEATKALNRAIEQGYTPSMVLLGDLYLKGVDLEHDVKKGL